MGREILILIGAYLITERLCHNDANRNHFQAHVVKTDGDAILLNQTAFYPGGGGQPEDFGLIRNIADIGRIKIIEFKSKGKINKRIVISLEV